MPKVAERQGKLVQLSVRITPELRAKLEEAASQSGRSLSSEIERRLELSFIHERLSDRSSWLR